MAGNNGFEMRLQTEQKYRSVRYASTQHSDANRWPKLTITYTQMQEAYYLKDHLGNIRVTLDGNGNVVTTDDYYPFGLQMPGRSYNMALTGSIYKYAGKELDEESGLDWYYFGARYYDPVIGRWLSVDPLAALVPNLTPFHYVRNNPINRIDAFGLTDDEPDDKDLPVYKADFVIVVEADRYQEEGYMWIGSGYYLTDENQREIYEKIRDSRRSLFYKVLEATVSVLNTYNPAHVLADEDIGVLIEGGQSVEKLTKQLTKFYKGKGVAVKSPRIRDFIQALAIVILTDPATNLRGPDLNSIFKKGESGVDTTFFDVGVGRTIKAIHYILPDTTINIEYSF